MKEWWQQPWQLGRAVRLALLQGQLPQQRRTPAVAHASSLCSQMADLVPQAEAAEAAARATRRMIQERTPAPSLALASISSLVAPCPRQSPTRTLSVRAATN